MSKKLQESLLQAVRQKNLTGVLLLLKSGVSPDFCGPHDTPPLHLALYLGDHEIVKALLAHGADVNFENETGLKPLDVAALLKRTAALRLLKARGASPSALSTGNTQMTQIFSATFAHEDIDPARHIAPPETPLRAKVKPKPKKPVFTEAGLKEIFNGANWAGKIAEMEKLWQDVPKRLQKKFDFAAALSEAKRHTLRTNRNRPGLKPPAPPQ